MRIKPILYNGPMVRAILSGTKTRTMRPMDLDIASAYEGDGWYETRDGVQVPILSLAPYAVGDILYCRETWAAMAIFDHLAPRDLEGTPIWYCDTNPDDPTNCGDDKGRWRPSIHMPREAARIWQEVTAVKALRIQETTYEDILAEGWDPRTSQPMTDGTAGEDARAWMQTTWDAIYGKRFPWDKNVWAWAYTTKRIER